MMLGGERLRMEYSNLIEQYNTVQFFTRRANTLKKINSYHMFPIEKAVFTDFPIIYYDDKARFTAASLLEQEVELLPTQIKNIVWQITKFMLHCEVKNISHLRLTPDAIVLREQFIPDKPIFIRVKDFSLGKEFESVSQGKQFPFFQYLHPDLSIGNGLPQFQSPHPQYDIWSLGVILYRLVYKRSPFCKEGKKIFSKTILRSFLAKQYDIHYLSNKYSSINRFIGSCLDTENGFKEWADARRWIVEQEEIYNKLDFIDCAFEQVAEMHLRLMALFSGIYCMIVDQCNNSPHPFWHKPISNSQRIPFQVKIAEFTLKLMKLYEDRFYRIYGSHLFLLARRKDVREALVLVSKRLEVELGYLGTEWVQEKFRKDGLTLQVIKVIQDVCVNVMLELSEDMQGSSRRIPAQGNRNSFTTRKIWKSMQTLHDYCDKVIYIFNQCKNRMKHVYEQFYLSKDLQTILIEDFGYRGLVSISLSEILSKIER